MGHRHGPWADQVRARAHRPAAGKSANQPGSAGANTKEAWRGIDLNGAALPPPCARPGDRPVRNGCGQPRGQVGPKPARRGASNALGAHNPHSPASQLGHGGRPPGRLAASESWGMDRNTRSALPLRAARRSSGNGQYPGRSTRHPAPRWLRHRAQTLAALQRAKARTAQRRCFFCWGSPSWIARRKVSGLRQLRPPFSDKRRALPIHPCAANGRHPAVLEA